MSSASSGGARIPRVTPPAEWDRLELAVRRLLDEHATCRRRAEAAERRAAELEAALQQVTGGAVDPLEMNARIEALEAENRALRERLEQARRAVGRLLARLDFLEADR
jgi:predicted RNase H-like nuclease (RuvC/YqgF family)